jgi:hypothetical protein
MLTDIFEIKKYLYNKYGGFADKRYTNITDGNNYIVDKRVDQPNYNPTSADCLMFLYVLDNRKMRLSMSGNIPMTTIVKNYISEQSATISQKGNGIELTLTPENYSVLVDLARIIENIVAPGKRYSVPSYKYVCPEISVALHRLKDNLAYIWLG